MQDVTLLAIGVVQKRQTRRAVRVIFNRSHARRNSLLLAAEIDGAILLLVSAAAVPHGDFAMRVAPASAILHRDQRFLRRLLGDLALIEHGQEAARCGVGPETFYRHDRSPFTRLRGLAVLNHFFAGSEFHVSFFPIAPVTGGT